MIIKNLVTENIHGITLLIEGITCILGDWDKDKSDIVDVLLGRKQFSGEINYLDISPSNIRLIPRNLEKPKISVSQLLKLFSKRYGGDYKLIMNFLNINDAQINELEDFDVFKVYLSSVFFGKTKLIISEDFLELMEEQAKYLALKYLLKVSKVLNSDLLIFMSSAEYSKICSKIYVIYGGKVLEEGKREFYHPYSQMIQRSLISIGKKFEKIDITEIGKPSEKGCPFHDYCYAIKKDKALFKKCALQEPPFFVKGENNVACWLYD
jgi:hypothetical protein